MPLQPTLQVCTIPVWNQMSDVNRLPHMTQHKDGGGYQQVLPTGGVISLNEGGTIILTCSGCTSQNNLKFAESESSVTVTCKHSSLYYKGIRLDFEKDVKCKKLVCNSVKNTGSCGRSGTEYQIGYEVHDRDDVLTDVLSCYDHSSWIPLYAFHVVHGRNLEGAKQIPRPDFRKGTLDNGRIIADVFQQKNQTEIFKHLTGTDKYITHSSYLEKGHLAPQGDFVYPTSQISSFYYINVAPQWKSINNGNWKSVEYDVRQFANRSVSDVQVYTGTYDVLNLNGKNIYLVQDRYLPVPKYIWKIVYASLAPRKNGAIVLIILNNPYARKVEPLCRSICGPYGWGKDERSKFSKGHVHCCDYREFRLKVPFVPDLDVTEVLSGPNPKTFV
ncbi:unnamed protein product [Acanthoscelides obtectus]|uniref:DNA/RNA non-specific endonuclease/pyrophosphatase/phosphodiesterase domain-containing protein n=1 Tax=Acanthoscelides obtectus TaxID=200917 RepID=A0A9P0LPH6_ACAOB|nr:unnamed protein product [Acanthoscelides obtectus]CAK1632880.1 hypothetical protein AOBTE_LOCUS7787 [Acanthoscelides obtectus]